MNRYFLITIDMGNRNVEVPFSTENSKFINRKEMIKQIKECGVFNNTIPIIKMIYEFQSEQDYLDFTN